LQIVSEQELYQLRKDISGPLPVAVAGRLRGYARSDQVSAVIYKGTDGAIYELALLPCANGLPCTTESWLLGNLTANSGAAPASSDPSPYVRSDGVDDIIY
jgi:hypothetical protein